MHVHHTLVVGRVFFSREQYGLLHVFIVMLTSCLLLIYSSLAKAPLSLPKQVGVSIFTFILYVVKLPATLYRRHIWTFHIVLYSRMDRIILVTSTVFLSPSTFPDKFELQIIRNNQFCEGAQPIFRALRLSLLLKCSQTRRYILRRGGSKYQFPIRGLVQGKRRCR